MKINTNKPKEKNTMKEKKTKKQTEKDYKANYMEFHYRKGPLVGWLLAMTCKKYQEAVEEDFGSIYIQFRQTTNHPSGD